MKCNLHLHYDSVILLLNIGQREISRYVHKKTCSEMLKAVLFIKTKNGKRINGNQQQDE